MAAATTPPGLLPPGVSTTPSPYHMTFRLLKDGKQLRRFTFLINPQQYSVSEPVNNTVMQTLDGGFLQAFGRGLAMISLQGTTASQTHITRSNKAMSGLDALKYLHEHIFTEFTDGQFMDPAHTYELRFYNWSLDQYYSIVWNPKGFTLQQDVTHPIWWFYTIQLVVIDLLPMPKSFRQKSLGSVLLQSMPPSAFVGTNAASTDVALNTFSTNAVATAVGVRNALLVVGAQLLALIGGGSTAYLSKAEQGALAAHPLIVIPGQALTNAAFPSYQSLTGTPAQKVETPATVVGLVRTTITPVVGAIGQATAQKIPFTYADVIGALSNWTALRRLISAQYASNPPTQLLGLMGQAIQGFSTLAALQNVYTATPAGPTMPL